MRPVLAPPPGGPVKPGPVPTFSVIIAAYQAADTVGEAVASALDQTVPPHEVIVCDDGSTDDIEGALAPYRGRISLLRRDRNGGEGAAKNVAARAATGEFVVILDADDVYLPERIEALGELAAARPDLDILTTDAHIEAGGIVVRRVYDETWEFEVADQRRAILERNFIFGLAAARRRLLLEAGGFDESIARTTDWDCWLRLIFAGARAGLVGEPLARYRLQEQALSSDRARLLRGRLQTLDKAARGLDLTAGERAVLVRSREAHGLSAALEEARSALLDRAPDARVRSLAIASQSRYGWLTRAKAAMSALMPGLGRRWLLSRERRRWVGAAGIRVPRRRA